MPNRKLLIVFAVLVLLSACTTTPPEPTATPAPQNTATSSPTDTPTPPPPTATFTPPPPPTATPTPPPTPPASIGPLRRVAELEPVLFGEIINFRLMPDDRLILTTTKGYAAISGEDIFLQITGYSQTLIGTDDQERMWFFLEDNGGMIYYWDGGLDFTLADQGWEPIEFVSDHKGQGVVTDGSGKVWLYTSIDVRMFDGLSWTIFDWEDLGMPVPPYEEMWSNLRLFYLPGVDQVWAASCYWGGPGPIGGAGARWFDGVEWQGAGSPADTDCVASIAEDNEGRIWMGVKDVLWRYDPTSEQWRSFAFPEPTEHHNFSIAYDIVIGPDGEPWVSLLLCGGANCEDFIRFRRDGSSWEQVSFVHYMPDTLLFDGNGDSWLFYRGDAVRGVYQIENNQPVLAADLDIHAVTVDAQGRIWLVANPWGGEIALWVLDGGE